jgi:endoribonuclease Dicer
MEIIMPTELPVVGGGLPQTRGYQQEMLEESLINNLIIALDTGSGKTHIAVLRMKFAAENEAKKVEHILTSNDI